jgi:hypothetical protein
MLIDPAAAGDCKQQQRHADQRSFQHATRANLAHIKTN